MCEVDLEETAMEVEVTMGTYCDDIYLLLSTVQYYLVCLQTIMCAYVQYMHLYHYF